MVILNGDHDEFFLSDYVSIDVAERKMRQKRRIEIARCFSIPHEVALQSIKPVKGTVREHLSFCNTILFCAAKERPMRLSFVMELAGQKFR